MYTCINRHLHQICEQPNDVKLGDVPVEAPCPLYTRNKYYGTMDSDDESLIAWSSSSMNEKMVSEPASKQVHKRKCSGIWSAILTIIGVGLFITLTVFAALLKGEEYGDPREGVITPPLAGPNGALPGKSVY